MKPFEIKKLYYSISEVSKITSIKPYVLRYWETEFPELKPSKNRAGNRIYRANDIKLILLIKRLLYKDKYTIEGAKQKLKYLKSKNNESMDLFHDQNKRRKIVTELRTQLLEILDILNKNDNRGVAQSG